MKYILILLLLSCCASSCNQKKQNYQLSPHEAAFNATISTCAAKLSKKYNLNCICVSGAMPGGPIRSFGLDFQIQGPLSQNELRFLLIHMASDFLTLINTDENVRPFLKKYPFTVRDISLTLFVYNKNRAAVVTPYITIAGLDEGEMYYKIFSDDPIPKTIKRYTESYEEAYEKVQKENNE